MLFVKNGIEIGINNPVCYDLFIKQGWEPVEGEDNLPETDPPIDEEPIKDEAVEVAEETVEDSQKDVASEELTIYKKGDFTTKSKAEIVELAESLGYTITATKKADMIDEFLSQQN